MTEHDDPLASDTLIASSVIEHYALRMFELLTLRPARPRGMYVPCFDSGLPRLQRQWCACARETEVE